MSLNVNIQDGAGSDRSAKVAADQSLLVSVGDPPLLTANESPKLQYFTGYLSSSGVVDNRTNAQMQVDGSSTAQKFYVGADPIADIHIMAAIILIGDTAVNHQTFGNVTQLTNGWDLIVTQGGRETLVVEKAQTGGQVIVQAGSYWPFGNGVTSNELLNWTGTTDAQLINFPFSEVIPGGLTLVRGTEDRLTSIVNDDLTGLTEFTVRVLGFKRIP
jgi:hypothetical protein